MTTRGNTWKTLSALGLLVAAAFVGFRAPDLALYNGTPSMPVGFYWRTDRPPERGAIVTVRAERVARDYAMQRGFTDPGDRFLKRVAAVEGDIVCARDLVVTINGVEAARRRIVDSEGRLLPNWQACRTLGLEVFLLGDSADSFDSRYFGPVPLDDIEATWRWVGSSERTTSGLARDDAEGKRAQPRRV